jgi:hypothetical protein
MNSVDSTKLKEKHSDEKLDENHVVLDGAGLLNFCGKYIWKCEQPLKGPISK